MKIVPYAESAFSEVVALWDACGLSVPYNDPAQDIALVQASANAALFLGYRGDRLIGTIMVGHDGHRGWLYRLAIAPEFAGSAPAARWCGTPRRGCRSIASARRS